MFVRPSTHLREVAWVFLRLGFTAFGGPAAHIALMEEVAVRRRGWVSRDEFLDLLGATQLIPGPNSTELAMHLGYRRAGSWGLWVAGTAFILPAAMMVTAIAAFYRHLPLHSAPGLKGAVSGIQSVMIAVVAQAILGLGRTSWNRPGMVILSLATLVVRHLGIHELLLLGAAGAMSALGSKRPPSASAGTAPVGTAGVVFPALSAIGPLTAVSLWLTNLPLVARLFLVFLKVGSVLYGSGYVLLAYLQADLVERLHWVTPTELLDAVAVGQVTPGPVLTTATFLGYVIAGPGGAATATLGIFLPAFVFVALTCRWLPTLRRTPRFEPFVDGVNAASLGLLADVAFQLGQVALVDVATSAIAVGSAILLIGFRLNSIWLLPAGALLGWIFNS